MIFNIIYQTRDFNLLFAFHIPFPPFFLWNSLHVKQGLCVCQVRAVDMWICDRHLVLEGVRGGLARIGMIIEAARITLDDPEPHPDGPSVYPHQSRAEELIFFTNFFSAVPCDHLGSFFVLHHFFLNFGTFE